MEERIAKQVIVMRKDLNMRKGKMIAQGAHASVATVLSTIVYKEGREFKSKIKVAENSPMYAWLKWRFTKICVSVDSEEALLAICDAAKEAGLIAELITDAGLTEFDGVPTHTCCAVGPGWADEVDKITGHLPLL